jgi:hypothetical protein
MLKAIVNLQSIKLKQKPRDGPLTKQKTFDIGNLVLLQSPRTESLGKLQPKWDGPYVVAKKSRSGLYCLSDSEGRMLMHSWNADNLRHFYIWQKL